MGRGLSQFQRVHPPPTPDSAPLTDGLHPRHRAEGVCDVYTLSRLRERVRA